MPIRARLQTENNAPKPQTFHHIWWAFLRLRLHQVRPQLPADLNGRIQIVIDRGVGISPAYLYMHVKGPDTEAGEGRIADAQTWIQTSEAELGNMLFSKEGGLKIDGDAELFVKVFDYLTTCEPGVTN